MLFNSFAFAVFLPIVFIIYWIMPKKQRWVALLAASYYFYLSWGVKYIFVIVFTTIVSYLAGLAIEKKRDNTRQKKLICGVAIVATLALLFVFKYFNFMNGAIVGLLQSFAIPVQGITLKLMLPVGISFYTFQTVGYLIDVYRGKVKAERHFGIYALFVSFFPRLVAGPIERASNLLPQLRQESKFDYDNGTYGLKLIALGLFKKLVIADNLVGYVDTVFNNVDQYTGFALLAASLMFTVQIYCDFSGYSDMAIGVAKVFNINLINNFKSPYFAFSVKDFWSRWHISLSTWFRDYLYIPLGGNRVGKFRHNLNLLITFIVSGFWHGANWTFMVWGGLHGIYQILEGLFCPWRKTSPMSEKDKKWTVKRALWWFINVVITFVLVSFAWIFFRANNFGDAYYLIGHMFEGIGNLYNYLYGGYALFGGINTIVYLAIPIFLLIIYDALSIKVDFLMAIKEKNFVARWFVYLLLVIVILLFSMKGEGAAFVYAQF